MKVRRTDLISSYRCYRRAPGDTGRGRGDVHGWWKDSESTCGSRVHRRTPAWRRGERFPKAESAAYRYGLPVQMQIAHRQVEQHAGTLTFRATPISHRRRLA